MDTHRGSPTEGDVPDQGVVVIGAGGHGLVVAAAIVASGLRVEGFYDDDRRLWGQANNGHRVMGPIADLEADGRRAIVAVGDNAMRKQLAEELDLDWITVVHPFSWVAPGVSLGIGTFVGAGTVVQPGSVVGEHVILNSRSGLGHEAKVRSYAHLSHAYLGSGASAGEGALLAIGSSVLPGVAVHDWAVVGAGALATRDVDAGTTVVGIPARPRDDR